MEDSLHNTGSSGGFMQNMTTKNLILVFSGVFLFVALMSGLYLSTQTQNVAPKAQVPSSCQGDNVYVSDNCGGDAIVGTVPGNSLGGDPNASSQLCCQRQAVAPTEAPRQETPPTDAPAPTANVEPSKVADQPAPTDVAPTDKPTLPGPTTAPNATEAPVPTSGPACRQAPDFSVDIIINECPNCLGTTTP